MESIKQLKQKDRKVRLNEGLYHLPYPGVGLWNKAVLKSFMLMMMMMVWLSLIICPLPSLFYSCLLWPCLFCWCIYLLIGRSETYLGYLWCVQVKSNVVARDNQSDLICTQGWWNFAWQEIFCSPVLLDSASNLIFIWPWLDSHRHPDLSK